MFSSRYILKLYALRTLFPVAFAIALFTGGNQPAIAQAQPSAKKVDLGAGQAAVKDNASPSLQTSVAASNEPLHIIALKDHQGRDAHLAVGCSK